MDFVADPVDIVFQPGQNKSSADIQIIDDTVIEAEIEQFTVNFVVPQGAQPGTTETANVNIIDNDRCELAIISNDSVCSYFYYYK